MTDSRKFYSRTYTEKHRKFCIDRTQNTKWLRLKSSARHIFYAMWNSPRTNPAGVYRGSAKTLLLETAINQNRRISEGIKELVETGLIVPIQEGGWYLPDWFSDNLSGNARSFLQKALNDLEKMEDSSFLKQFISDHRTSIHRILGPEGIDHLQNADLQDSSINRYAVVAVTDTEDGVISATKCEEFQRVTQSLKRKIDPRRHKEFDEIISDIVEERIDYAEALSRLAPFGLAGVEHEELLCALPDKGLYN